MSRSCSSKSEVLLGEERTLSDLAPLTIDGKVLPERGELYQYVQVVDDRDSPDEYYLVTGFSKSWAGNVVVCTLSENGTFSKWIPDIFSAPNHWGCMMKLVSKCVSD